MRLLLILLLVTFGLKAQVPQGIPYQAIARNGQGQPLANLPVKVRFSILDSTLTGTAVYSETHDPTTSAQGLFSVNVGMGNSTIGAFSSINWRMNAKFLKVELDTTASGNNYVDLGTQQMMSVPYAFFAGVANNLTTSALSTISNGFSEMQVYNVPGIYNWTAPNGVYRAKVECWGGGQGGAINIYPGTAGSYASAVVNITPGQVYSIRVGSGGVGNLVSNQTSRNGVNSFFSNLVVAIGGGQTGSMTGQVKIFGQKGFLYTVPGGNVGAAGGGAPFGTAAAIEIAGGQYFNTDGTTPANLNGIFPGGGAPAPIGNGAGGMVIIHY